MQIIPFLLSLSICLWSCQQAGQKTPAETLAVATSQGNQVTLDSILAPKTSFSADSFDLSYVMGQFDPAQHPDFTLVDRKYADREGLYLRKDTYVAFLRMQEAAQKDGVQLQIRSATRNFDYQKSIWEGKWTGNRTIESGQNAAKAYPNAKDRALKILEYSSMPGSSRHHWGTDMDLNAFTNEYFESGQGLKIYNWLVDNAPAYGFCQPYSQKGEARPNGYNEEKWHWSYLPIARQLTELARRQLQDEMIQGFKGAETAVEIGIVEKYVLGISGACE